jgi:arginine utilization protein RocB
MSMTSQDNTNRSGASMKLNVAKRIEQLMLDLVAIRSDTGTPLEKEVETHIFNWLAGMDYFKHHPQQCGRHLLAEDPLKRSVIWGLLKGSSARTVILMHHHDVVDAFDYGQLTRQAYYPDELHAEMLRQSLSDEARQDLKSGQWIFGRGTADMKGGAAIQLVLLEALSKRADLNGNVLLLSVPDEENLSTGMRGCLKLILELGDRFDLHYRMLIDSEPHLRDEDGAGILFEGSAGKILPVVFVRGRKTHVGQVFDGLNPVLLLSEIVLRTEMNPDFCDAAYAEVSPPPSWMSFKDRKERYDVSVPLSAGGYFNLIFLKRNPKALMDQLKLTCEAACRQVAETIRARHGQFLRKKAGQQSSPGWEIKVKTFSELYEEALRDSGSGFQQAYARKLGQIVAEIREDRIRMPEATFRLIDKTMQFVSDLSPAVVIALSPPYYPPLTNADFEGLPEAVRSLSSHLRALADRTWDETYRTVNYMMGITDMSYAALQDSERIVPHIGPNMPLWQTAYDIPFEEMQALSLPVINIGPWGKDCHKYTERVFKPDLLERTPQMLLWAIEYLLSQQ